MLKIKFLHCFTFILCLGQWICCLAQTPNQSPLFSEQNIQTLKTDPAALLSKNNSCRVKTILGEKDFKTFSETMSLVSVVEDEPNYVSISGNVRGLFTVMEGFFRISKLGQVWIAYLQDGKIHYFTNDDASLNKPPQVMLQWSSRFKDAKWINQQIKLQPDKCD